MSSTSITLSSHRNDGTDFFFIDFNLNVAPGEYIIITNFTEVYTNLTVTNLTNGGIYTASPFSVRTLPSSPTTFRLSYNVISDTNNHVFQSNSYLASNDSFVSNEYLNSITNLSTVSSNILEVFRGTFIFLNASSHREFVSFDLAGTNWKNSNVASSNGYSIEDFDSSTLKLSIGLNAANDVLSNIKVLN